jgi:predicted nucleic acid-binding protein
VSFELTYLDSGILLNAFRGVTPVSLRAVQVLDQEPQGFATSAFVQLETLPKAIYNQQQEEAEFYTAFFSSDVVWASKLDQILREGDRIARTYGLAGMDAIHIAAALSVGSTKFVTTEKPTKPMHRVTELQVVSIAS